jgi:hypothetical protein
VVVLKHSLPQEIWMFRNVQTWLLQILMARVASVAKDSSNSIKCYKNVLAAHQTSRPCSLRENKIPTLRSTVLAPGKLNLMLSILASTAVAKRVPIISHLEIRIL